MPYFVTVCSAIVVLFDLFYLFCVFSRKMPIKEFYLDRVLRDLEMTQEQVKCCFESV